MPRAPSKGSPVQPIARCTDTPGRPKLMRMRAIFLLGVVLLAGCKQGPVLGFGSPQTLATHDAADPTIAIDGHSGKTYVAWAAMEADKTWNVLVASAAEAGSFTTPVRVNQVAGEAVSSTQFPPQVRVGPDGVVHVAWLALLPVPDSTNQDKVAVIRVARSVDRGTTFEPPVTLGIDAKGPFPSLYFGMAAGPDNAVYVTWLDLSRFVAEEAAEATNKPATPPAPVDGDLRLARSSDGGKTFGMTAVLDANACICCRTAVAAGEKGVAYLMWRHVFPVNERDVVVATAPSSGTISAPIRVHDDHWKLDGCPDLGPDIGVGTDGSVHVAWYTGAAGSQGLHYARSIDAAHKFGPPVSLLTGPAIPSAQVKLAVAGNVPWLVWEQSRPSGTVLRLAHISASDQVELVKEPVGTGMSPAIAVGHGQVAVAWSDKGAVRVRLGQLGR